MTIFLSEDEVAELTGFKSRARQRQWLSERGWRFVLSGSGKPIVARKYAEKMLGCGSDDGTPSTLAPNFGAILRAV